MRTKPFGEQCIASFGQIDRTEEGIATGQVSPVICLDPEWRTMDEQSDPQARAEQAIASVVLGLQSWCSQGMWASQVGCDRRNRMHGGEKMNVENAPKLTSYTPSPPKLK